jgi:CubicO group peptidase (beta-lactamase class C family)
MIRPFRIGGFVLFALLSALSLPSCSDESCPFCVEGVDPDRLVDPATLGDGSGYPGLQWTTVQDPRILGWSKKRLQSMSDYATSLGSDGFMVVDRGVGVWEHGSTSRNLIVQSCRKSFLAALYGAYYEQGLVDLEATMGDLGIDDLPPSLTEEEKQATVEQLLKARSGVYHEAAAESQSMKDSRPPRGSHPPGTFWYYNNWDFNVLGTLFVQLTGKDLFDALFQDFAQPLQMQEFQPANGMYYYEDMSEHPAYHFSMSPRDMARFGLLVLRDGRWRGQQLVPSTWMDRMLSPYSDAGDTWSYGYMWWIGKPQAWNGHTVYAARGGSGQAIFVIKDLEIVITHKVASRWTGGWSQVYALILGILDAKVL